MMKRRGGQKQRSKEDDVWNHHRDPNRGGSGKAVIQLEKLGWEQGKGLGDGGGRVGKPWGLHGHMVQKEEIQETVQLMWQWQFCTPEEAKYWCEAAGVDYHQVIIFFMLVLANFSCNMRHLPNIYFLSTGGIWWTPTSGPVALAAIPCYSSEAFDNFSLGGGTPFQKVC